MTWMITASGAEYHLRGYGAHRPGGRPVLIEDIAHQLAIINRFHGATCRPYSVAEHSLLCSEIAQRAGASMTVQMAALMHDAHEAYTNDLSSPAKEIVNYRAVASGGTQAWNVFEHEHELVVRTHFGLLTAFTGHRALLREIDLTALATERRDLTLWEEGTSSPWAVLGDDSARPEDRVQPVGWLNLDTPEREAMSWRDWRQAFRDRFDELHFGIALMHCGAAA